MLIERLDDEKASELLPPRPKNANKGTFGRALLITGSPTYRGAALLSVEAALRSGVGYLYYASDKETSDVLLARFPEVIFRLFDTENREDTVRFSAEADATLFGCGSGNTKETKDTAKALCRTEGKPLVLDADALNAVADEAKTVFLNAQRPLLITPHPGEFSRLLGIPVREIEKDRVAYAVSFAEKTHALVLLKGHKTVITDGTRVFVNETGDTSLSKAGSGDVLAGLITGLCATGATPLYAAALGAYLHGKAGESMGLSLSPYGVTASDLPVAIAKEILKIQK